MDRISDPAARLRLDLGLCLLAVNRARNFGSCQYRVAALAMARDCEAAPVGARAAEASMWHSSYFAMAPPRAI